MENWLERASELVRQAAAEFLAREAGPQSLITVTGAALSSDFSRAIVLMTVLPESAEEAALGLARRQTEDFKKFLRGRAKLPRVPRVEFRIDEGQKSAQRLDELLD